MDPLFAELILNYSELSSEEKDLTELYDYTWSGNVSTNGKRLEFFTRDLLCGSLDITDKSDKIDAHKKELSWLGSANNPPDLIIRDGPAIEVKKTRSKAGNLQMNSSPPHQTLHNDSDLINKGCKECESELGGWSEKEMVYSVGRISSGKLDYLWLVYGDCWCGENELYEELFTSIKDSIKNNVDQFPYGELKETNELGRINDVDPVSRASLRIRPMWQIEHPASDYSEYVDSYKQVISDNQPLFFVVKKKEYDTLPTEYHTKLESKDNITIQELTAPDPSSKDQTIRCIMVSVDA